MTLEELIIAIVRVLGSLVVFKWAFIGAGSRSSST